MRNAAKVKRYSVAGDIPGGTFVQDEIYADSEVVDDGGTTNTTYYYRSMDWTNEDCEYGLETYASVINNTYQQTVYGRIVTQDLSGSISYSNPILLWTFSNHFSQTVTVRIADDTFLVVAAHYYAEVAVVKINRTGVASISSRTQVSMYSRSGLSQCIRVIQAPTNLNRFVLQELTQNCIIEVRDTGVFEIAGLNYSYQGTFIADSLFAHLSGSAMYFTRIHSSSTGTTSYVNIPGAVGISGVAGYMYLSPDRTLIIFDDVISSSSNFRHLFYMIVETDDTGFPYKPNVKFVQNKTQLTTGELVQSTNGARQCMIDGDKLLLFVPTQSNYYNVHKPYMFIYTDAVAELIPYNTISLYPQSFDLVGCTGNVMPIKSQRRKKNVIACITCGAGNNPTKKILGTYGTAIRTAYSKVHGLTITKCTDTKQGTIWRWKRP